MVSPCFSPHSDIAQAVSLSQQWVACTATWPLVFLSPEPPFAPDLHRTNTPRYIRQLTNGTTQGALDTALTAIATIRDKSTLFLRVDSWPPMSNCTTDWRDASAADADFGFARPHAFRFPFDTVTTGISVVYPPRLNEGPSGEDEGNEFSIGFEKDLADGLVADPEWNRFFEFRGVDAEEGTGQRLA